MRTLIRSLTAAALSIAAASTLSAQPLRPRPVQPLPPPDRAEIMRERMLDRREAMLDRREAMLNRQLGPQGRRPMLQRPMARRMAVRANVRATMRQNGIENLRAMTPEQRTQARAFQDAGRTQRRAMQDRLLDGKITREQARTEMQQWRKDHPRPQFNVRPRRPGDIE